MASKDVFTATRVDQPRDFTINGETKTAQAGNYILTDTEGNIQILDSSTYEQGYADAGTGVVGEVSLVKPKRTDKEAGTLDLSPPENASVEFKKDGERVLVPNEGPKPDAKPETKADSKTATTGKQKATEAVQASETGVKASEVTGATDAKVGPAADGDKTPTSNETEAK